MAHIISRRTVFFLFSLTVATAIACDAPTSEDKKPSVAPSPSVESNAPRVVFLGDSLSAGLGLAEREAFPAVTGDLLQTAGMRINVVNAGVSGDTSAGGLSRLDWVLGPGADILVVELGGNDALRGQPLENTESNLRQIVRRGREKGARVLLLGMDIPSNYGSDYTYAFAEMYRRIAEEEGAIMVPGFVQEVGMDPTLMQADGLHPTAEGHRRLAGILAPHIALLLDEMPK